MTRKLKTITKYAMSLMAGVALTVACSDDDKEAGLTLEVDPLLVEAPANGSTATIKVTSSAASWTAKSNADWAVVGNKTATSFTVSVQANISTEERAAEITVSLESSASVTKTVTVKQAGLGEGETVLSVDPASWDAPDSGVTKELTVTCNSEWTASSSEPWATVLPANGAGSSKITVTLTANYTDEARTAAITLRAGDKTAATQITQQATTLPEPGNNSLMQNFEPWKLAQFTSDTLVDSRDHRQYTVRKMADYKVWMTQNLAYKPADSDSWMYTNNDAENDLSVWGLLYKSDATPSVCPEGWRLPSTYEFTAMRNAEVNAEHGPMNSALCRATAGATASTHTEVAWVDGDNVHNATNETGFGLVPSGRAKPDRISNVWGIGACLALSESSSESDHGTHVWVMSKDIGDDRGGSSEGYDYFAVRCIKSLVFTDITTLPYSESGTWSDNVVYNFTTGPGWYSPDGEMIYKYTATANGTLTLLDEVGNMLEFFVWNNEEKFNVYDVPEWLGQRSYKWELPVTAGTTYYIEVTLKTWEGGQGNPASTYKLKVTFE